LWNHYCMYHIRQQTRLFVSITPSLQIISYKAGLRKAIFAISDTRQYNFSAISSSIFNLPHRHYTLILLQRHLLAYFRIGKSGTAVTNEGPPTNIDNNRFISRATGKMYYSSNDILLNQGILLLYTDGWEKW
jgi:hypothetical protein